MRDLLAAIEAWRSEGQRVAVATLVGVEGSAPRGPGAALAVGEHGEVVGSVSGGCVEAAVYEEAQDAIRTGRPRLVTYGITDERAAEVGLTCGGTIRVYVERLDGARFERLAAALRANVPVATATVVDGPAVGATVLVLEAETFGTLGVFGGEHESDGASVLDAAVVREARAMLESGATAMRVFVDAIAPAGEAAHGLRGAPAAGETVHVFIATWVSKPRMLIFGAIDVARALATVATFLGYRVTVVDARPVFATRERVPDADEVVVAWPDEYLRATAVDARTAVVILTHDVKFDVPLIEVALAAGVGYVGAMGSRRTHANRVALLRERGYGDAELARVHAPIGLDIGARTPEETAVSIVAEIVAVRSGRGGDSLCRGALPIHATTRTSVPRR